MAFIQYKNRLNSRANQDNTSMVLMEHGYKLGKVIGEGSYSRVREAFKYYKNGYFSKVACKIVDRSKASKEFVDKFLPRELAILKELNHPHLVQVHCVLEVKDQVFIFMEMCHKGDLLDYITHKGPIPEFKTRHLFKQIVSAVAYIHSYDFSHRDLKCENVLMRDEHIICITDFGFARHCRDDRTNCRVLSETFCGSAAYAAPEIIQGLAYNPKMYDVWSLGCILYIMLTASMPFDDTNCNKMLYVQLHKLLAFPPKTDIRITNDMRKLIMHLLEPDVTKRATIQQVYHELNQLPPITSPKNRQPFSKSHFNRRENHPSKQYEKINEKEITEMRKHFQKMAFPNNR